MKQENFQVNLEGLIQLLSGHLYKSEDVFIRELLQNATDAISMREQINPGFRGSIEVELIFENEEPAHLVFTDNGIGLTEDEVHRFLSTIGSSIKSQQTQSYDYIGQFGIGILSCFIVTEEVVMVTRSAKGGPALEWRGRADGSYTIRKLESDLSIGTRVFIGAREKMKQYFEPEFMTEKIRHYGNYLQFPILLIKDDLIRQVNTAFFPWERYYDDAEEQRAAWLQYGNTGQQYDFLDVIPVNLHEGKTKGLIFVDSRTRYNAKERHHIYIKRMLLSHEIGGILPQWASFFQCVLNTEELRPMASRDQLMEDDNLYRIRKALGIELKNYLLNLARTNAPQLLTMIQYYSSAFYHVATLDDEFCEFILPHLLFNTTEGIMPLGKFVEHAGILRYTENNGEFDRIKGLGLNLSLPVLDAVGSETGTLIEKYKKFFPNQKYQKVTLSTYLEALAPPSPEMETKCKELVRQSAHILYQFRCTIGLRSFEPKELPFLFTRASVQDRHFRRQDPEKLLYFNTESQFVRRLAECKDPQLLDSLIRLIYVQASFNAREAPSREITRLLERSLNELLDMGTKTG
ncbi:MAG: HSP90 family protein [Bacteroidia bacterium]